MVNGTLERIGLIKYPVSQLSPQRWLNESERHHFPSSCQTSTSLESPPTKLRHSNTSIGLLGIAVSIEYPADPTPSGRRRAINTKGVTDKRNRKEQSKRTKKPANSQTNLTHRRTVLSVWISGTSVDLCVLLWIERMFSET